MALSTLPRRKLKTFLAMRGADRLLVCEAMAMLALAQLIVLIVPFRYMPWLGRTPEADFFDKELLLRVRKALTICAQYVPWNAESLSQAMAGKTMLARRGCGSTLHLGATIDMNGKLIAHAWLLYGGEVVIGATGIPDMSALTHSG
jgi:hypothetical protein